MMLFVDMFPMFLLAVSFAKQCMLLLFPSSTPSHVCAVLSCRVALFD